MPTHLMNESMLSDDFYVCGDLLYLVAGNECRLLDKRRTPGVIKSIDIEAGFFRWEISDFEDKGKHWDVEFERIDTYQFKKGSVKVEATQIEAFKTRITALSNIVEVHATASTLQITNRNIANRISQAEQWFDAHSFTLPAVDFQCVQGPILVRDHFIRFMASLGMGEIESLTSEAQVLNPHSGEWIKAMQIVMAEMGLKTYRGKSIRSQNAFSGLGSVDRRKTYIECRLGFIRALFYRLGLQEVELYRGMSTEWDWQPERLNQYRFWSSWTFNYKVAQDFAELEPGNKHKNSYLIKRSIPVDRLFMTFIETDAMNRQYLEAEAIVLHIEDDRLLW